MSIAATVGLPIVTGIPTCIHDGFVAIEDLRSIDQTYLLYVLKSLQDELRASGQTGSQANVNTEIVKGLVIPVPSIAEQQAIATALHDTDRLIVSLKRLIAKKQAIKQGMMKQLLTGKTRFPGFTAEWTDAPLGSVTTWLSGGTPNRGNPSYWNGTIPWISAASLKQTWIRDSEQRITEAGVRAGSQLAPEGAALVLVRGMALHREVRIGLAARPVSFNQDVKALIPQPILLPKFLLYSLQARSSQILGLVSSAGSGTGVLDTGLLKRLSIGLPDMAEQRAIAETLTDADDEIETLQRRFEKARATKAGMMQQLLTGRTRLPVREAVS